MLPPDRVLSEMQSLGFTATELGPAGYLPLDADSLRAELDRFGLRLVAGFVPLVLHQPTLDSTRERADRIAATLAGAGAEVFVGAVVMDEAWSPPEPLDGDERARVVAHLAEIAELAESHGLAFALHPHVGTLVEKAADIDWLLEESSVNFCLDTGHYLIGGKDPAEFARRHAGRISHVHLKDVDAGLAQRVRDGELSLVEATQSGLFRPLGQGDAEIGEVVALLDELGYDGWLVLEQDTAITGEEPPVGRGPVLDVQSSIEYLEGLAPTTRGEVSRS